MASKVVTLASLGLCEHCNTLMTLEDMPTDAFDSEWQCPSCDGKLSHLSFGFDRGTQGAKKVKWVGPDSQWVGQKPEDDFDLGSWLVMCPPKFQF